jgi:hypothetical protein
MVKSDEMAHTMRRIVMRNNRSRALSENAKVIEATSHHRPQILEGVRNYVHIIIKTLAWYNIVLEIPEDCTVFVLKKKIGVILGYHVMQYTMYLIIFNKLVLRSKISSRSTPKRYVHNKLCTELIILKS